MQSRVLDRCGIDADLMKALASETRARILGLLAAGDMNINELGRALGISQPSVTKHMQILEQAGLVRSEYLPGIQGMQKRCHLCYSRIVLSLDTDVRPTPAAEEVEMPLGLYTLVNPSGTCGLASRERVIGFLDKPQSFYAPERASAQLLWMADGFVEYVFPNLLPVTAEVWRIELSMEICSEAPNYENDYPSDITLWVNGVEVGTWTSPGDLGGRRGRLNPGWWSDHMTQHGLLKLWSIDETGCYVDGACVSAKTLRDFMVGAQAPITVRIGTKPDAVHAGGFTLLGRGFGNYEQDLALRLHYVSRGREHRPVVATGRDYTKGGETQS